VKLAFIVLAGCAMARPAFADEPVGTDLPKVASGARVTFPIPFAAIVALVPFADAKLPMPPERTPKAPDSFAGFFDAKAPAQAGSYKITLSAEGWVDVAQSGHAVKASAFSGALGCEGLRKSVKFDLPGRPLALQFSGVPKDQISVIVSPDP